MSDSNECIWSVKTTEEEVTYSTLCGKSFTFSIVFACPFQLGWDYCGTCGKKIVYKETESNND